MVEEIDEKSLYILKALSKNSRLSSRKIAGLLRMHPTTVIKKIKEMEREKIITKYTINVDYEKLGYGITALVFVQFEFGNYDIQKLVKISEVTSMYEITGDYDIMCVIIAKNRSNLKDIIHSISMTPGVKRTYTVMVLKTTKEPMFAF